MSLFRPNRKAFRFKRIVIIAGSLMTLDAFVLGIPSYGFIAMLLLVTASAVAAFVFLFKNRSFAKLFLIKAGVYLVASACIFFIFKFNTHTGAKNAESIIESVEAYYADHREYPRELNQLMPNYLKNIPNCAYRVFYKSYRYTYDQNDPSLIWFVMPPYGRRVYEFKDAEWIVVD
jgi:hypothetical protein